MAAPYNQRITASSFHLCTADKKKFEKMGFPTDVENRFVGGKRSVPSTMLVKCDTNSPVQIVQADAYRESLIIYPPNDATILRAVIAWHPNPDPDIDIVIPTNYPLILSRKEHGALVTYPIWAYYKS